LLSTIFFTAPATPDIYTLSLHDALPICRRHSHAHAGAKHITAFVAESISEMPLDVASDQSMLKAATSHGINLTIVVFTLADGFRSEEHTSELQSQSNLVCRLLLEKKKKK